MEHVELKDLILVYEDLSGDEKALADKHLSECETCSLLLADLQKVEKVDVGWGDLPANPGQDQLNPMEHLSTQEQADAHLSRQQLLETVNRESVVSGPSWWRGNTGFLGMALAACVALVIWSPWAGSSDDYILDFRMTSQSVVRGETTVLKPGDPFVMRFSMGMDGWPVVVGMTAGEKPELLFPTDSDKGFRLAANRNVILPPPGSGTKWAFDSAKTYVVLISGTTEPEVAGLASMLDGFVGSVDLLVGVLEQEFGNATLVGH